MVSDALLLRKGECDIKAVVILLTSTLSSGKPPLTLRSHIKMGEPSPTSNQTRNRPVVSSEFNGTTETAVRAGGGNVKSNSVDTHEARCSLSTDIQSERLSGRQTAIPATLRGACVRDASFQANNAYPIAKLDNNARVRERTRWHKESCIEHLLTRLLRG